MPAATIEARPESANPVGLSEAEAATRLVRDGPNELVPPAPLSRWRILVRQFRSPVVALLVAAGAISAGLGERWEAGAILAIVIVNACVSYLQEYRAETAARALRGLTAPRATAVRSGIARLIPAAEVVVGDLLSLQAGDIVAADGHVELARDLSVNQAQLTGESLPVGKTEVPGAPDLPALERPDLAFMASQVTRGTGLVRVTATGMHTELGRIAQLLESVERGQTPLERRLARTTKILIRASLAIVLLVAVLGFARRLPVFDVLLAAVSLAIAAIPEGVPALVTVALSRGVQRMARRNVLVRRLSAVETLGCATVICSDKTGTLTTGIMRVRELVGADTDALLDAAVACCDAELDANGQSSSGDPTEVALLVAGRERGIERTTIERERPRTWVEPFSHETKRMRVARADGNVYVKGALEALTPICVGETSNLARRASELGAAGLRVLAIAIGKAPDPDRLSLLGVCGIADPPRPQSSAAVAAARRAGITVVMITGDHPSTAQAIAREIGILRPHDAQAEVVRARTTPEQKLDIVANWKARGAVVAMTGDGVNDAPALRAAHIGIAMGKSGTEVTREAADIVLTDDDFASIVAGVEEGRCTFDNIRKALVYLLATNTAELGMMLIAAVLALPLPLLPVQLLWINLVTDALPALALAMDPPHSDALGRPPRDPEEPLLGRTEWLQVGFAGAVLTAVTLAMFMGFSSSRDLATARSVAFGTLVLGQLWLALASRNARRTYFVDRPLANPVLPLVALGSALAQLLLPEFRVTQRIFQLSPWRLGDLSLVLGASLVPVTLVELMKLALALRTAPPQREDSTQ